MIIFLYGDDAWRRDKKRNFYAKEFEKKYGLPPETMDLSEESADALFRKSGEASLFSPKKLILLKNPFALEAKVLKKALEPFLENKEIHLVVTEDKKPVKALEFLLKPPVKTEVFESLEGPLWIKFVKDSAKEIGAEIEEAALLLLAASYEGNTWGLVTELQKLAYAKKKLSKEDLFGLGVDVGADSFPLIQGLKNPSSTIRLRSLEVLFAMHEPGAKIFNILAALSPANISRFAKYDEAIKFGRMDYEDALLDIAL